MSKESWQILFIFVISIAAIAWGYHGVVHGDKIRKRADYILSVFQIMGGITFFVWLLIYFALKLSGRW